MPASGIPPPSMKPLTPPQLPLPPLPPPPPPLPLLLPLPPSLFLGHEQALQSSKGGQGDNRSKGEETHHRSPVALPCDSTSHQIFGILIPQHPNPPRIETTPLSAFYSCFYVLLM